MNDMLKNNLGKIIAIAAVLILIGVLKWGNFSLKDYAKSKKEENYHPSEQIVPTMPPQAQPLTQKQWELAYEKERQNN